MDYKIVSQLDSNGYFVCPVEADESPLEPGVFLIPGGAIDFPPPKSIPKGKRAKYHNKRWVYEIIPTQPPLEGNPDKPESEKRIDAVRSILDSKAQEMRYDDIVSAVSYAEESCVPKFQAEGIALRAWRSLVWEKCFQILDEVENESREMPTEEEFIAELPEFTFEYTGLEEE